MLDADDENYVALAFPLSIPLWTSNKKLLNGLRRKRSNLLISTADIPAQLAQRR